MLEKKNRLRYVFPDHAPPFATIFTCTFDSAWKSVLTLPPLFTHRLSAETFLTFNRACEEEQQMTHTRFMPDLYFGVEVTRRHGNLHCTFRHCLVATSILHVAATQAATTVICWLADGPRHTWEFFNIHSCWQVQPHKWYQDGCDLCTGLWSVPFSVENWKLPCPTILKGLRPDLWHYSMHCAGY